MSCHGDRPQCQALPDATVMLRVHDADPLHVLVTQAFAEDLMAKHLPSVQAIRARLLFTQRLSSV